MDPRNDPSRKPTTAKKHEIIQTCFHQVSSLIRNSPSNELDDNGKKIHVSDSIRLKLYGYYKCATTDDDSEITTTRPSLFDPVGRAKYDAWVECQEVCDGDGIIAMEKYVEVAASQSQTVVGRNCGEIYREAREKIERLEQQHSGVAVTGDDDDENVCGEETLAERNNDASLSKGLSSEKYAVLEKNEEEKTQNEARKLVSNAKKILPKEMASKKIMGTREQFRDIDQSTNQNSLSWITSFLPAPLIPRGQLDISFQDLGVALFHCIQHAIYVTFIGGGIVHRFLSFILPSFVMALINISFSTFHPRQCAERYERKIVTRWLEMEGGSLVGKSDGAPSTEVVVGLSVRSLFDLYLSAQSYPEGSEVLVVPPVTIAGMMDVMRYHDLVLVPVDLPSVDEQPISINIAENDARGNKDTASIITNATNIEEDRCTTTRWGIDLIAVKAAITKKTVAIFVVHPFGTVVADQQTMLQLRTIADENKLDIWEDCAQCYTGKSTNTTSFSANKNDSKGAASLSLGYMGSKYSNISFFSFGPIKTATALGGGLAVLRPTDPNSETNHDATNRQQSESNRTEEMSNAMRRIQDTMFGQQTNFSYFARIITCLVVHLASHSRLACGTLKLFLDTVGMDYDNFVVSSLSGFSSSSRQYKDGDSRSNAACQRKLLIVQLRRRPCPALLALIYRRLHHSANTERKVRGRLKRCQSFGKQLLDYQTNQGKSGEDIILPKSIHGSSMHGWLFPILVQNPHQVSKNMLKRGYDVPCGMTQLKPVASTDEKGKCPRTCAVFERILYLPVPSQNFSTKDDIKLIKALMDAMSGRSSASLHCYGDDSIGQNVQSTRRRKHRLSSMHRGAIFAVALVEWQFPIVGLFHNQSLKRAFIFILRIVPWVCVSAGIILFMILLLCRYMGSIYLKSSNTFAKYCDMLFQSPFRDTCSKEKNCGLSKAEFLQSKSVLKMASTAIPQLQPQSQEVAPKVDSEGEKNSDQPQMVLLTGATGFVGSLLLRELLIHRQSLMIPGGVVVIVRSKRGKSARERIDRLLSSSMFGFLTGKEKTSLVRVVNGDVALPDCGMKDGDIKAICSLNILHIFHCAAAVSFSQPLEDAAMSNITSTLQMRSFTKKLRNKNAKFVYISTAFVHGGRTGTKSDPLPEDLFNMHPYDPVELYKSMLGTQSYASAAMNELGFPNTYTFSKCICEHLLLAENDVKTILIRPSIVGPSVHEPYEGWAGEKPSTIVAAACLYLKFPYNVWCFGKELVPFVPVDVVCRAVISRSFGKGCLDVSESNATSFSESDGEEKKDNSFADLYMKRRIQKTIVTVAWDASSSESASFSWLNYAFTITHLGSVCGHVNRVVAYAGLLLSTKIFPQLGFSLDTFQRLHSLFVRAPINGILDFCDKLPWKPRFARDLKIMGPILDLPLLFFPFANQKFYFKSDIVSPIDFNGERYMFSCAVAAHRFICMLEQRRKRTSSTTNASNFREYENTNHSMMIQQGSNSVIVAGANHAQPLSDLWWALTQPQGNFFIRFGGWVLAKVFRHTALEIEIDVASFVALARAMSIPPNSTRPNVVIAPTHRSFYDFLIVSYVCFSLPELGLEMPYIAAASDFSRIPIIGWLANRSHAFFLRRGGTKLDPSLKKNLTKITEDNQTSSFIEVFIEGKRSRHRTFLPPKTGFLKCLAETGRENIVLPLTINYEGLPDQASLIEEANGGRRGKMTLSLLLDWISRAFSGNINIGRVYISASNALDMRTSKHDEIRKLGYCIQTHQQKRVLVSKFHVIAACFALDLQQQVVVEALSSLGCVFWPELEDDTKSPPMPKTQDLMWTLMLQFGHVFAPFFLASHPQWSSWLSPAFERSAGKNSPNDAVGDIVAKLATYFDAAEKAVDDALEKLKAKGFHTPKESHVSQYLPNDTAVPLFLMKVAVEIKMKSMNQTELNSNQKEFLRNNFSAKPLFFSGLAGIRDKENQCNPNSEAFGAWGYRDSYFVLNIRRDGSKCVTMKGARYGISGKKLPGLVKFVEDELQAAINPEYVNFPSCLDLRNIPQSELTTDDIIQLESLLSNDSSRVSLDVVDRARHGTGHTQEDMYNLRSGAIEIRLPDAIVWPQNESEIQELVSLASKLDWCLIPFGGGTNVSHSTHCPTREMDPRPMISVDMKLMSRVLWVNEEDGLAHVEAGITGLQLIQYMKKLGLTIGHEPDSYEFSTLGGWIATKASGMKQNKYGNIEDIVKEVRVVGAKHVISEQHKLKKTSFGRVSTGVDLKSLMLGSEGCFGIITSAVIKVWPIAETRQYESVLLPSFDSGLKFVKEISKMRMMKPASVRLLDNDQFRLGRALKEAPSKFESLRNLASKQIGYYLGNFHERSVVCATITFEGNSSEVQVQRNAVRNLVVNHGGILAGSSVGKAGYDLTFAIAYLRDFAMNYGIIGESFESFVPWSKLTQVVDATKSKIYTEHSKRALPGMPFVCCRITQLYDEGACVYFYFCMDTNGVSEPSAVFGEIESSARQEILDNGGSLSHHHGLGKIRSQFVDQIYTEGYIDSLIAVKKALDPCNTFGARNGVFSKMGDDNSTPLRKLD